jgi:toxin ParE1/3/4
MRRPVYSPRARLDLLELWLLIAESSGSARADAYLRRIEEKCDLLAASPTLGRPRSHWGRGVRSWTVDNYLIVYRVAGGRVRISRLMHGAQDLDELFGG